MFGLCLLSLLVQEPGGGFHAPPPPSGLTYMGWKIIKKYYLIHLFPKKILVPRPQKWGLKMGQILNLFSKCCEKYHKMDIFWKKLVYSIPPNYVLKFWSFMSIKISNIGIPYQTQKLKNAILSFPEKKSNVSIFIFVNILKVKLKCYPTLGCAIKKILIWHAIFGIKHFQNGTFWIFNQKVPKTKK